MRIKRGRELKIEQGLKTMRQKNYKPMSRENAKPITIFWKKKKKDTTKDTEKKARMYLSLGLFSKLPANVCWGWESSNS